MTRHKKQNNKIVKLLGSLIVLVIVVGSILFFLKLNGQNHSSNTQYKSVESTTSKVSSNNSSNNIDKYTPDKAEINYLNDKFNKLKSENSDTIGYIYAPGTELDEPVVQTKDNSTYLTKTFDGQNVPFLGAVFMDTNSKKDFSNDLTWLFGHARGSKVGDHRMFNDVNYYSDQKYFDQHPYVVVETPQRKIYYEDVAMVIVPEETAFYQTSFASKKDFKKQLQIIYDLAEVKNSKIKIDENDKYMVLSTCREEDPSIRANLYLRRIPDNEMKTFVKEHKDELEYKPTR